MKETKRTNQKLNYTQLKNMVFEMPIRMTRYDVICYLVGYKNTVTKHDLILIRKLYMADLIDSK